MIRLRAEELGLLVANVAQWRGGVELELELELGLGLELEHRMWEAAELRAERVVRLPQTCMCGVSGRTLGRGSLRPTLPAVVWPSPM